jgi:hypothetical protein
MKPSRNLASIIPFLAVKKVFFGDFLNNREHFFLFITDIAGKP